MRTPVVLRCATALATIITSTLSMAAVAPSAHAAKSVTPVGLVSAAPSVTSATFGSTDALAIAVDPSTPGGSVAFDAGRGDRVSASIAAPLGSVPEQLSMSANTPGTSGPSTDAILWISNPQTLVVGRNEAVGRLDVFVNGRGCAVTSGTITVADLGRDTTGLTSFSGSFDATCGNKPVRGVLRWHSALSYTALELTPPVADMGRLVVDAGQVEVNDSTIRQVTVRNVGNAAAAVWPPTFTGPAAGDWSAATTSTCNNGSGLAPAATCTVDVVFAPSGGDQRQATMGVPSPDGPGWYDVSLTGVGVGQPTPPTNVQAGSSVFGTVLTWGLPTNSGGAQADSATIEKTTDGGGSWSALATVTGVSLDQRTYADRLGVAPGAQVGYRVATTQAKVVPGQTRTYSSQVSAVAVTTGARQSLVLDGISAYNGRQPITLRGSMNPDLPTPGFFLPSTDGGSWDQSPDGSEIIMTSNGAGTIAKPYELRRRPSPGSTVPSTPVYASAYPISEVAWSPDGTMVAWREYHRDNSESYLMVGSASGGGVRSLNLTNFWDFDWMPDSRTLAGISNTPNAGAVAFVDTRTGALTQTAVPAASISLAPDARRLVTITGALGFEKISFNVYTLDPNNRSLSAVVRTQKPAASISHVEFSPNGRELLTSTVYRFQRWPLTSGNVVGDPLASTVVAEISKITWHSYRPTLAPSPATTGPTTTFTIKPGQMAPGTTYQCAVDTSVLAGCSPSWTTPSLAPGRHTVRVIGTEPSGRSATTARTWQVSAPTLYTAVQPRRVLDTRTGVGAVKAKVGPGGRVTLTVPGLPTDTTAVTLNVTATNPTATGHLTVYPAGTAQPTASNLNVVRGQTVANLVMVRVGSGGKVTFFNSAGTIDVIADLAGYYRPTVGARFIARPPDRILDTRIGLGSAKATTGPGQVTIAVPGLPAGTTAVALNVTVTNPTSAGYLTVHATGKARPIASNLNFVKGQTAANMVIVPVGTGGKVTFYHSAGTVDVVADIAGFYAPSSNGARFTGVTPARVLDTRVGIGTPTAKVGPGSEVTLTLPDLPDGVVAVALNVTATDATAPSFLTVYPAGQTMPWVSNLNVRTGQTVPNLVIAGVGPNNTITFYNDKGSVNVIADLAGYFGP